MNRASLQLIATHCNILHHTASRCNKLEQTVHPAKHCNTLQHAALHYTPTPSSRVLTVKAPPRYECVASCCNRLQHTTTHCITLHHIKTHRNALQHAAPRCNTLHAIALELGPDGEGTTKVLMSRVPPHHPATHCNTLQRTATQCSTWQHTAAHGEIWQHIVTHCNTL